MTTTPVGLTRREYLLRGVVQGVGFRPHVAQVAARHSVTGFCGNDDQQVFVEIQGVDSALDDFFAEMLATLPPLARVLAISRSSCPVVAGEDGFRIVPSRRRDGARTLIPPDVATCADCLADMADPANRRYRYPFTTCTNCGPRLTIIEDLPYDRPATTMRRFAMCPACATEYSDPTGRRYHAQPISCFDCGPKLWLADAGTGESEPDAIDAAGQQQVIAEGLRRLQDGQILAVKGLGGFHLICDARNPAAVERLRKRKRRSGKPFAVMVADPAAATKLAVLDSVQQAVLTSPARPILIAPMASGYDLAEQVAPGLGDVGVMLPYTGLHHLLVEAGMALVATSGNLTEEPLCYRNAEAIQRLSRLADCFLLHDRPIAVPVEDSVMLAQPGSRIVPVRRSRGQAPLPVLLPAVHGPQPTVLAVGGELKNTFTLGEGEQAFVSAHVGDMGSLASQEAFEASVGQLLNIHRSRPEVVVCDLHPGYATTAWAQRYAQAHPEVELIEVQHHLAHALSLLAEHGIANGPAVVATLDGTGYGVEDGQASIWGGEILVLGAGSDSSPWFWRRAWQVPSFSLVGGDRAIRQPWRVAQGLAYDWGLQIDDTPATVAAPPAELALVRSQLQGGHQVVPTSSAGRLFDAASALLGICLGANYEAQAAMELERAAASWRPDSAPVLPGGLSEVFAELLEQHRPLPERAWRFHLGLAAIIGGELCRLAGEVGTEIVGLSGGVALNRVFTAALSAVLAERGLKLITHQVVPPNDGGLSLGQVWAGRLASSVAG